MIITPPLTDAQHSAIVADIRAFYAIEQFSMYSTLFDGVDQIATTDADDTAGVPVTYSWWMKSTNAGNSGIFDHGGTTIGAFSANRWVSNRVLWQRAGQNYTYFTGSLSSTAPQDGAWHHWLLYAATDISDTELFIDGVAQSQASLKGTHSPTAYSTGIRLGLINGVYLDGNMDEFAIFSGDATEHVSTIYNGGDPADLTSLAPLHWWRMGDRDSDPEMIVHGSGGENLTMVNDPTLELDTPSS